MIKRELGEVSSFNVLLLFNLCSILACTLFRKKIVEWPVKAFPGLVHLIPRKIMKRYTIVYYYDNKERLTYNLFRH